jgi:hypothetical protein
MLRPLEHRFQTTERRAQRVRIRSGETDSPSVLATTRPGPTSNASATASAQHLPTATAAAICRSSAKRASRTHERGGLTPHWWPRPARRRPICRAAAGLARLSSASLPLFLALPRREKRKRRIFCGASWKPKWNGSECSVRVCGCIVRPDLNQFVILGDGTIAYLFLAGGHRGRPRPKPMTYGPPRTRREARPERVGWVT